MVVKVFDAFQCRSDDVLDIGLGQLEETRTTYQPPGGKDQTASLTLPCSQMRENSSPPSASSKDRYHLDLLSNQSYSLTMDGWV